MLDVLFRIIYPIDMPTIKSLGLGDKYDNELDYFRYDAGIGEITELLAAAEKYAVIKRFSSTFSSLLVSIPWVGYDLHDHAEPETVLLLACTYIFGGRVTASAATVSPVT